jgi:hypothetical protein
MAGMKSIRTIDVADLEDIAIGGAILGTGGGGDPYIGKLMAQQAIRRHGKVRLVDVDDFDDDALVAPVCMMGAPTVMTEKLRPRSTSAWTWGSIFCLRPAGSRRSRPDMPSLPLGGHRSPDP